VCGRNRLHGKQRTDVREGKREERVLDLYEPCEPTGRTATALVTSVCARSTRRP
jgi:hypothetical protein